MKKRRLAFRVQYDGTEFHGWQAQRGELRTVQGVLCEAIADVVGHAVLVNGASRTDAGVHARDQLAAISIDHPIPAQAFIKAVNRRLPRDVATRDATEVEEGFQPRFDNHGKMYCYRLYLASERRPLLDRFATHLRGELDTEVMQAAGQTLVGTHDFTSFAASHGSHQNAVRTLTRLEVREAGGVVEIEVSGQAFLKQMVRNIAGTLIEVGRGLRGADSVADILVARDRRAAGPTAPARGLTLERVF